MLPRVKELVENGYTILFHESDTIKDTEYLFTLRQTQDGEFISDQSILDLWLNSLDKVSWVNPGENFKYALEVYQKRKGYFESIAPVILCDGETNLSLDKVEELFKDLKKPIDKQVYRSNELTQEFGKALEIIGFNKQRVGGGCSIKI